MFSIRNTDAVFDLEVAVKLTDGNWLHYENKIRGGNVATCTQIVRSAMVSAKLNEFVTVAEYGKVLVVPLSSIQYIEYNLVAK
jgi:hypothetical protein